MVFNCRHLIDSVNNPQEDGTIVIEAIYGADETGDGWAESTVFNGQITFTSISHHNIDLLSFCGVSFVFDGGEHFNFEGTGSISGWMILAFLELSQVALWVDL